MKFIQNLLTEFDLSKLKPDANGEKKEINVADITSGTHDSLDHEAKMDEIDTITFGLETEDNQIVKVYIKAEEADDFEKALSQMLGKEDSIENALNELAKTFDIIDVEWPGDDSEEGDESDEEGSELLDKKVYDNEAEKKDKNSLAKTESYGSKVADRLLGEAKAGETQKTEKSVEVAPKELKPTAPTSDKAETKDTSSPSGEDIKIPGAQVVSDIEHMLGALGLHVNKENFVSGIKSRIMKTVKSLSIPQKMAIQRFRREYDKIENHDDAVQESASVEHLMTSKFKMSNEKNIFNAIKFLVLGNDSGDHLSTFLKQTTVMPLIASIKKSKFKSNEYRNILKMFIKRSEISESVGYDEFVAMFMVESQPLKDSDHYENLAKRDNAVEIALEMLSHMGFSERILNHADIKKELVTNVRHAMWGLLHSSEGRRLKLLFGWNGKEGTLGSSRLKKDKNKKKEKEEDVKEEVWTDTSHLKKFVDVNDIDDFTDTQADLDAERADKVKAKEKKADNGDGPQKCRWKVTATDEGLTLENGKIHIELDTENLEKLTKAIGDERHAIVVKDNKGTQFILSAVADSKGDYAIVQKGKHDKYLLTSKDIDKFA
jgi:hypothetical protein